MFPLRAYLSHPLKHLCQLLQVHTGIRQRNLHSHPRIALHLCIPEAVCFFSCSEQSLDGFFPVTVQVPHPICAASRLFDDEHSGCIGTDTDSSCTRQDCSYTPDIPPGSLCCSLRLYLPDIDSSRNTHRKHTHLFERTPSLS